MIFWLFQRPAPVIVDARPRDAAELALIHATGFERGWDALELERMLADRAVIGHVARARGRGPAGGFALSRQVLDEAELLTVAVLPKARGAGLGRLILKTHFARIAAQGVRTIFLEVAEDNVSAVGLYRRFGFEEVGRRAGYYARRGGAPATALVMRRSIG
jgi:ribosomal-protein-alanine N-acetyltransferase